MVDLPSKSELKVQKAETSGGIVNVIVVVLQLRQVGIYCTVNRNLAVVCATNFDRNPYVFMVVQEKAVVDCIAFGSI